MYSMDTNQQGLYGTGWGTGKGTYQRSTAVVKETWIKPSRIAPEGAVLVTANEKLLGLSVWPEYCNMRYPFAKIDYIRRPGSVYGQGLVYDLIPIQRRHNKALSIIVEVQNILAQLGVAVPKGTSIKKVLAGMGTVFELPPGSTQSAQNILGPQIGDIPFKELEQTREGFRSISFQHQITQGDNPPNVRAGNHAEMLKEFDDSASVVSMRTIERAVERVGNIVIDIARYEWTSDRTVMILSRENDIERKSLMNYQQVTKSGQYVVQSGSAWPYLKAEKQNLILQLVQFQMISPEEALKFLEMGGVNRILDDRQIDVRHARRENQTFDLWEPGINPATGGADIGQLPAPADWHNHEVHIIEHNNMRKHPEYASWSPQKMQMFEAHITAHEVSLRVGMAVMASEQASIPVSAQISEDLQQQEDLELQQEQQELEHSMGMEKDQQQNEFKATEAKAKTAEKKPAKEKR